MRKQTKTSLTRKLDKICSEIIRKNPCARCGEAQHNKLQCAHIFSRVYRNVRWDLLNLISLCTSCHFWAHRNPVLFTELIQNHLYREWNYSKLKRRMQKSKKWTLLEMRELYESLKKVRDGE